MATQDINYLKNKNKDFHNVLDTVVPAPVVLTDAAAVTLTKSLHQGRVCVVPDLTADSTFTVPAAEAAGEWYKFIYGGAAADAQNFIIQVGPGQTSYIKGSLMWVNQNNSSDDGTSIWSDNDSNELVTVVAPESFEVNLVAYSTAFLYMWGWVGAVAIPTIAD